ncbi:helix-turn-helix domain-containing protein [Paenibacillus sp. SAF-054]|uniref:helix-turn-helix domain-containing protein n=1 Tax=unclassified Paenibacillus TaxID=185978 RepID=UPI003F7EF3EC
MDKRGISQDEVCRLSGVSRNTVSRACNEDNPPLRTITKNNLISAIKKLTGESISSKDFWA